VCEYQAKERSPIGKRINLSKEQQDLEGIKVCKTSKNAQEQ
jgi:hypothetical protein